MEKVWVTEKPDMAKNLVAGLSRAFGLTVTNRASVSKDGYYQLSNGDVVSYFFGHMLQTAAPAAYMTKDQQAMHPPDYFKFLPLVVTDFKYEPKPEISRDGKVSMRDGKPMPARQYSVLCKLLKQAKAIVNAGDVDREGQLIVDEMLEHLGIDPIGRVKPIFRLPLVSAREEDIAAQVQNLVERNGDEKWVRRRHAALARSYCDWGLGMNSSMAYQSVTGYRRMSVGRIQTPVVRLVVERDEQISRFKPHNYFIPVITLEDGTVMRWHTREGCEGMPGFDELGRITDKAVAERICSVISSGMKGRVNIAKNERKEIAPPKPFSASVLASTVAKRYGMTPKEAEAAAQALYEKHKAISYVGTDCQFLPESMLKDAQSTLRNLSKFFPSQASGADASLKSAAWNDAKVDEHHAIVPTGVMPVGASQAERAVYDTVSKRYMAQFYPSYQYMKKSLGAVFGADEFRSVSQETLRAGWRQVEGDEEMGGRDAEAVDTDGDTETKVDRDTGRQR